MHRAPSWDKIVLNCFEIIFPNPKSQRWTNGTHGWNFGQTGEQKIKANKKRLTMKKKGNGGKEIEKKGRKTGKKYGSVSDR